VSADSRCPLPPYIRTLIEVTVKKMVGSCGFGKSDREELEQQIAFEVIRRRSRFDPAKAQEETFLARLVEHAAADIFAARKAGNRDYRREEGALGEWTRDRTGKWVRRGEKEAAKVVEQRTGQPVAMPEELRDLAIDMAEAAAKLPAPLREVYEQFRTHGSGQDVARVTGLHRSSVYEALAQIRQRFEEAGLGDYLA
jgi:RNA polymerase sigma-70 factor (ECF subfamily)